MGFKQKLVYMAVGILLLFLSIGCDSFNRPKLSEVRSFKIYAKEGEAKVIRDGKIVEQTPDKSFQNGEIQFMLIGGEKAMMYTNTDVKEVRVTQEKGSISFIESAESRNMKTGFMEKHVLIIYDDWDEKEDGFRFAYTRNFDDFWERGTLRETYKGIAKPDIGR